VKGIVLWKDGDFGRLGEMRRNGGGIICYDNETVEVLRRRTMWRGCTHQELC